MKHSHYVAIRYEREIFAFQCPADAGEIDDMTSEISSLIQHNLPEPVCSWNSDDGHEMCDDREIWFKFPTHGMEAELVLYLLAEIDATIEALNGEYAQQLSPNETLLRTITREHVYRNNDELPTTLYIGVTWEIVKK